MKKLIGVMAAVVLALEADGATMRRVSSSAKPAPEPITRTVTLDVKDATASEIFGALKKQCGIRNLIIDPDVQARGTFVFRQLPCGTAVAVVSESLGLKATIAGAPHMVRVQSRR